MSDPQAVSAHPIVRILQRLEEHFLALLLGTMIVLAVMQVVARNLFDTGFVWSDPLVRILVLWVGLAGAMMASRHHNHITLDVLTRHLPNRFIPWVELVTDLFTAGVTGLLTYHSARFVWFEYQDATTAFAGVPSWVCQLILPLAFGVMCLRALIQSWHCLRGQSDIGVPK